MEILRNLLPIVWILNMFIATLALRTAKGFWRIVNIFIVVTGFLWGIFETLNNFIN
jgi:hypothetical protein